jgi:hypothetical protein
MGAGDRVMEEPERQKSEKAEASVKRREPPEYRRFKRLLKKVIKAPPLRKHPIERTPAG